jgi:hypothetical protein
MRNLIQIGPLKRRSLDSLLGLTLDGSRLDGVVVRRVNGALHPQQTFSVSLSLDPLTAEPELVGREIRNHLDAAGIRERNCVLGLPLKWMLTTHCEVPQLPEEDVTSFLQLEAERGFHSDVATLHFAASRCQLASGKQSALLVGVPRSHLSRIEQELQAAKLKPIGFGLGITALQPPAADAAHGVMAIAIGETNVGLEITCGGGVAALRALEAALETEGSRQILHADLVAREARITLGQLPAELRESVHHVRIFGPRDLAQQLSDELELRLEHMGLKVEIVSRYAPGEFGLQLPLESAVSPALSLAASRLAGRKPPFEMLPPRVTAWQQLADRYSSGKLRMAGATGAAVALLVILAFVVQQIQLISLRSQWAGMAPKVKELQALQDQIRKYRPWYDETFRGLTLMKQITGAFPDTGVVSAKTLEIRDLSAVTCTGVARDQGEVLNMFDRLSSSGGVSDFHGGPLRGKMPNIQFTFTFNWSEGNKNAN